MIPSEMHSLLSNLPEMMLPPNLVDRDRLDRAFGFIDEALDATLALDGDSATRFATIAQLPSLYGTSVTNLRAPEFLARLEGSGRYNNECERMHASWEWVCRHWGTPDLVNYVVNLLTGADLSLEIMSSATARQSRALKSTQSRAVGSMAVGGESDTRILIWCFIASGCDSAQIQKLTNVFGGIGEFLRMLEFWCIPCGVRISLKFSRNDGVDGAAIGGAPVGYCSIR
ncbi:MAG: hypothetical protein IPM94_13425 [bacterium]|nr:hypothetical protein [bacterium]